MEAIERLREFKQKCKALPDAAKRAAFASEEFKSLVVRAQGAAAARPVSDCVSHCFSHCGSHCYGHKF